MTDDERARAFLSDPRYPGKPYEFKVRALAAMLAAVREEVFKECATEVLFHAYARDFANWCERKVASLHVEK